MSVRSFRRSRERAERVEARRRSRRAALATGAAIGAGVVLASPASAANFTVDTLDDPGNGDGCAATDCSLREAIADADANSEADTISFASGLTGEITLQSELAITSAEPITINGPGVSVVSISGDTDGDDLPGSVDTNIFEVGAGADLRISGLTLTEGSSQDPKYGGALTVFAGGKAALTNVTATGNYADYTGGAIVNEGSLTVTGSELSDNAAILGGAISAPGPKYAPSPYGTETTVENTTITGNYAQYFGAGIFAFGGKYGYSPGDPDPNPDKGILTVSGSKITGNESGTVGGAVFSKYATNDITDTEISGNAASDVAGVFLLGGDSAIDTVQISGNEAISGGGSGYDSALAAAKYARLDLTNSTITGNKTDGNATVGVFSELGSGSKYDTVPAGDVNISKTTIAGNTADTGSGGIGFGGIPAGNSLTISESTISGNTGGPDSLGGGISVYRGVDGDVLISDSTISGNSAGYGGGIATGQPYATPPANPSNAYGAPIVENSTIAANTATVAGGGIYLGGYSTDSSTPGSPSASADMTLSSTIVADNTASGSANDLAAATVDEPGSFEAGSSLLETPGSAPVTQNPAGSSILGTDPQLGALADNGGPTRTQLPAKGSPVVDKGVANGLSTDQRGLARTVGGGTDIGSVEVQADPPPPDTTAPVITISKKPKKKLGTRKARRNVRIGFKSDEPGSTFECKINGAAFKPCDRPFKKKLKAKPGKGAKYKIQIRATDPAGNTGKAAKVKVRVVRKG